MSRKQLQHVTESSETELVEKKESTQQIDSGTSLQRFLNSIPISAIPVLALKTGDSVRDAIRLLYEKNVCGAPIAEPASGGFSEPFIGFIDFATMLLWCLEHGVIYLLLQSSGLEWFNSIADKLLTDVRIGKEDHVANVYGDQSIAEALHALWKYQSGVVAITARESDGLIGSIRNSDLYLLLDDDDILQHISILTVDKFIHMEPSITISDDATIEPDLGALLSAGFLHLKNGFSPRMDSPVTNKRNHTLLQAVADTGKYSCGGKKCEAKKTQTIQQRS